VSAKKAQNSKLLLEKIGVESLEDLVDMFGDKEWE
jgi:hypothetical protein